jgi:alpha-L-fucosidase 2
MNKFLFALILIAFPVFVFAQKKPVKKTKAAPTAISVAGTASIQLPLKLWYESPANYFEETLVLGNGTQGATVFGGISTDKIYLNDLTLWSGEPVNANMNPNAYKHLPDVRKALQDKNYKKAEQLIKKLQGKFSESYAPLGTLLIKMNDDPYINDYYRELDLDRAIAKVKTISNSNVIEREYLVSNPDKIFAIHFTSKTPGALGFTIAFEDQLPIITLLFKDLHL